MNLFRALGWGLSDSRTIESGKERPQAVYTILLATAVVLTVDIAPAKALLAQEVHGDATLSPGLVRVAQASQTRHFSVPAQPLSRALVAFGKQAGLQVSFETDAVRGLRSRAIFGDMPAHNALKRMLDGTGLESNYVGRSGAVVHRPNVVVAQADTGIVLDTIVVTGEKVERPYLETYTSVGVATGAEIETYNLDDLNEVFNTMANVRDFDSNRGNNGFEIRGIGADGVTEPTINAPVISVIIDGVTQSAEGLKRGSRGTWDLKQVEVLRGPQSMLQGRNALAGAVVIESNDPTYVPELKLRAIGGDLERKDGAFAFSTPIIPNQLAFRLSGEFRDQTKDITYTAPENEPLAEDKYRNMRGKLLIEPNAIPGLSVLLTASQVYDKPGTGAVSGPDFFARTLTTPSTFTEFREMNVENYSAKASYELGDRLTLHSLTAKNDTALDISNAPSSTTYIRDDTRVDDDVMQDVRIEISDVGRGLSGVIGAFYGNFDQHTESYIEYLGLVYQDGVIENRTKTNAVYADLRYGLFDRLTLIGGLRYQKDEVHNLQDFNSVFGPTFSDGTAEFEVLLPKYGLAFEITENQAIATTATRGYRQGFTEPVLGTPGLINAVDPEYMWTYEVAYRKSSPDNRLTFGANVFYNEYTDQQITIVNPAAAPFTNTFNVGQSISYGAEFEGRYDFGNGFNVFGALGLLKTKFETFEDVSCTGGSCEGNEYPEAPAVTLGFGGNYRHQSGFFASASANYTSDYYGWGKINNEPEFKIDSRFIANAKVGYEFENLKASIYVDNVFDEQYLTGLSSLTEATVGDGRTVGFEVLATF